jgi:hypothetical protein
MVHATMNMEAPRQFVHFILSLFGRCLRVCCWMLFIGILPAILHGREADSNLLRELLDLPSPPPGGKKTEQLKYPPRDAWVFDKKEIPADDAPDKDLLAYWTVQSQTTYFGRAEDFPKLSIISAGKVLAEIEKTPEKLDGFLKHLPGNPQIAETVKRIFDHSQEVEAIDGRWRDSVRDWLKHNSRFYLDELIADASLARDQQKYGSVNYEDELKALAKIDREAVMPLLKKFENDISNPRTAALAKVLLYTLAISTGDDREMERYRNGLKNILTDQNSPALARDTASDALFETEWPGRDDYYLSLMEDESLLSPSDKYGSFAPLTTLPRRNPDKWIPILTKLVGSPNRAIHNAAVQSLLLFKNRKDALKPLLPWLKDPEWADDANDRTRLIHGVPDVDLPESVPGLIWIVENDKYYAYGNAAAQSLAKYKDPRAIPALKKAFNRIEEEYFRNDIIEALIACGGLSEGEQLAALESYAKYIAKPENLEKVKDGILYRGDPLPAKVSIGRFVSDQKEPAEGLIQSVFKRQKILRKDNPKVARILSDIMAKWQGRYVDLGMLRKISAGEADTETILTLLARRVDLRKSVMSNPNAFLGKAGPAAGIAACLLEDEKKILSVFRRPDEETKISVLACSRLIRAKLPVHEVGGLLSSPNKLLALAAERYLESEDSPEARGLVLSRHPGEALILGARTSFNPARTYSRFSVSLAKFFAGATDWYMNSMYPDSERMASLDEFEDKLRREVLDNNDLLEIYAFVPEQVIRVFRDRAVYTRYEDKARFRQKVLKSEELADLKNWVAESNIEEMKPIIGPCHTGCGLFEYVRIDRNGGRRIFIYAMGASGLPFSILKMRESKETKLRYYLQDKINGLEILWTDNYLKPRIVWKNGDDLRILIEDVKKEDQIHEEIRKQEKIDEENRLLDRDEKSARVRARREERAYEHFQWRSFRDGRLGDSAEEPADFPYLRDRKASAWAEDLGYNESKWQAKYGNFEIRTGQGYPTNGLWKVDRSGQFRIVTGRFEGNVFVSGDWAVSSKTDENVGVLNCVARVNLQTGKEYRVDLPSANTFLPVALAPAHNRVLLCRSSDKNSHKWISNQCPVNSEYYLLDAATGETQRVKGEFRPLIQQTERPLQPASAPFTYWAALYDEAKNRTEIGRYDAKKFIFEPVLSIPEIELDSMDIWVDEMEGNVYFIYSGGHSEAHLLRLPLSPN